MSDRLAPQAGIGPTGWPPGWLIAALVALTAVRLAVAALTGLTEDEAYYRLWALAPSHGYLDHAPMVAWWMAAGIGLAGDGEFGLRLLNPLAALGGSLALWRTAALLFDGETATRAVAWFNAMILIAAGSIVLTPDAPSVLFWGLALWALAELWASDDGRWWLAVGLFAGLGLLSKYTVLFLGAGLALWVVATPSGRRWLATPWPWLGGLLALLLFSPVIYWNWQYEWASFIKQIGRADRLQGYSPRFLGEIAVATLGLANPGLLLLACVGFALALRRGFGRGDAGWLILPLTTLPLLVYAVWHGLSGRVQPNWLTPLYPAVAVLGAAAAEHFAAHSADYAPRLRAMATGVGRTVIPLGAVASALLYAHAAIGLVAVAGNRDPLNQTRGWDGLVAELKPVMAIAGASWIATSNYATAGPLAFAAGDIPVIQLDERIRYAHLPAPDPAMIARPGVYVELERRDQGPTLGSRFGEATRIATLERSFRGKPIARYAVWRVAAAKPEAIDPAPVPRRAW